MEHGRNDANPGFGANDPVATNVGASVPWDQTPVAAGDYFFRAWLLNRCPGIIFRNARETDTEMGGGEK